MDEILNSINPFGRYQKLSLFLIGLTTILVSMPIYSSIFILAKPNFKCYPINPVNESILTNDTTCNIWSKIRSINKNYTNIECKYEKTHYGKTVINEWNLICDRQFLAGIPQTIYMIGTFSCFGIGFFSDKFGRRPLLLMLCIFLSINLSFSQALQLEYFNFSISSKFIIFTASNFLTGCAVASIYSVSIVLSLELTTKKYSTMATNIGLYMYVLGEIIVLIIAFFLRNWHLINTVNAVFSFIVTILIYFFLNESPRYLEQQKKYHEAYIVLRKIAKINNREENLKKENELVQDLIKKNSSDDFNCHNDACLNSENDNVRMDLLNNKLKFKPFNNSVFLFVFSTKKNLIQICLLVYIWFAIQLIYFGMSLGITLVGHGAINPYLMFILSSIAEIFGYMSCHMNDKFGRKRMFIIFLALSSVVCLAVAIVPSPIENKNNSNMFLSWNSIIVLIMASFGKATVSAAYSSLFIYTCQLFPTKTRNTLLLFVSSIGRIGSIISPLINHLGSLIWERLPYFIFSSGSFLACIFVFILSDPAESNFS